MEQHRSGLPGSTEFDVGVWDMKIREPPTQLPSCSHKLDITADGKAIAVVREKQIELWDTATSKLLKPAPFKQTRIDAARFSPAGKLLAVSDNNEVIFWRWEQNTFERIDVKRRVGSLAFSPDGKFLAEGPTPGESIQIRHLETRKVVGTLTDRAKRTMNIPHLAYAQKERVLISCDNVEPHTISLWDTADGSLAHQISVSTGVPQSLAVSPNERHLVTVIKDNDDLNLSVWRLDGQTPEVSSGPTPPADVQQR